MQNQWTFDGVQLASFGAVTLLDSYLDLPAKRGDNVQVPLRHGKLFVPKYYDSRVISFGMEIAGTDIADLEAKMDALKTLLSTPTQKILLNSMYNCEPRQVLAEVVNTLSLSRDPDPLVATIVIDFLLAEPFFRSVDLMDSGEAIGESPHSYGINNPGSAPETKAIVQLTGPLSHPIITNTTTGSVFQYDDDLADNTHIITIDCGAFTALDETNANVIAKIIHSGDIPFFSLAPGDNTIVVVDGFASGGIIHVLWYPPWL